MTRRIVGTVAVWSLMVGAALAQSSELVKEIVVVGNKKVPKEVILRTMSTKIGSIFSTEKIIKDETLINDMGFFSVVRIVPTPLEFGAYRLTVNLAEYEVIKEIRVVGNSVVPTADILKRIKYKTGELYNLRLQAESAQAVLQLYQERGYFVAVEDFGPLADSPSTLNLSLKEFKVGKVEITGETKTKKNVFAKIIRTKSGEAFNDTRWLADQKRLFDTQWFEPFEETRVPRPGTSILDLGLKLKDQRTGIFNVGLQVDPRSSFAGILSLSENNWNGSGQSVRVNYQQATRGIGPSMDLDYSNPFLDNKGTGFSASIYSRILFRFAQPFASTSPLTNQNTFNERRTGATTGWSRIIDDFTTYGLAIRAERVVTNNIGVTDPKSFIQQDGPVAVLTASYTRDTRDAAMNASRGKYFRFQLEPGYTKIEKVGGAAPANVLGAGGFVRAYFDYRTYFTSQPRRKLLDDPRKVIAFRVQGGATSGKLPFFEQFFTGGDNSIRGYVNDRFWGRYMFLSNLEYRHPIQRGFSAFTFLDFGGTWGGYGTVNNFTQSGTPKFHAGYGLGIGFQSPFGPIQIAVGFNEKGQSRTHFVIGVNW